MSQPKDGGPRHTKSNRTERFKTSNPGNTLAHLSLLNLIICTLKQASTDTKTKYFLKLLKAVPSKDSQEHKTQRLQV